MGEVSFHSGWSPQVGITELVQWLYLSLSESPSLGTGREQESRQGSAPAPDAGTDLGWHHLSAGCIVSFLPGWFLPACACTNLILQRLPAFRL